MFWLDWRELEKHNDWGVRDKDDATAAMWNDGADMWEARSRQELKFAQDQVNALDHITKDTTVLDVCCGTGPLTISLCQKAKHVTAFDFNEKMLDYVRQKTKDAGLENVDFLQGNFNTITAGVDFSPADVVVTRHSPAQGNILKFSTFASKYCYSLALAVPAKDSIPLPGRKGGRWLKSSNENENTQVRPDGRKYGLNITFNLLYEAGANPEIHYVTDRKTFTAQSPDELAKLVFPAGHNLEMIEYLSIHAAKTESGLCYERIQTMAVMGWDPREIQWDELKKLGIEW